MNDQMAQSPKGRSPFFWGGMIMLSYAVIAGLSITDAIDAPLNFILMIAPAGLMVPLFRSASRRIDQGGSIMCGKGQAQLRYTKRVMICTALYLASFGLMVFFIDQREPSEALRTVLAVPPGLAVIGIFWAVGRLIIEEQDEFVRMLIIRQSLIASGFSLSIASVWGFLEAADVVPHADAYWWPVAWFIGLAIGAVMNRIKFGSWGAV
ncbi:hypothetical protein [Pontixanthobacter luteolus]|uniref:hypothetical protein n=1 Tax=Pontixanthobacter luteolus TaxID=295089 RepID=UPI00230469AF|nr:hypothetical protein [Pontixanthobacter luteolus]